MIVAKKEFEVYGNTVLAPQEPIKKRRYEDLEKSRKQVNQSKRQNDIKNKKRVLKNIFIGFVIGMIIIARYCMIYSYQQASSKAKTEIDTISKENDAYAVDLIKFRNISYIEKTATTKLHMVKPKVSDIQYFNLSKNNLETNDNTKIRISNTVVNKIKNVMF
ncbi:cell division protein FtsL [Clostridium frigoris]|uniref:Cell division protein FtsL n=1 Tax=Clostridium frigoris TaxID=205327 RepID=A0ABS6BSP5_9CLOT|nr:cell division protein FtsL [Clostridium frigoris]MBU3159009.1 cell division protein FtsL [Clostridium frigoris]